MNKLEKNYTKTSKNITVSVIPTFLSEQSVPDKNIYVWSYHVTIHNKSGRPVKLTHRHWHIVDSQGNISEVKGEGVIGEQPIIQDNKSFDYSSGTFLNTPSGIMKGKYKILCITSGRSFNVEIPMFSLDSPYDVQRPC